MNAVALDPGAVALALLLAVINNRIVAFLAEPVRKRYPGLDLWWMVYVSLATGFVLAWFSGANILAGVVPNGLVGAIVTGLLVGGGASLIHDVTDKSNDDLRF